MPAGPGDVTSPGGLATMYHHWSGGLGGPGDITPDVFGGTGERYPHGEYGSLYQPASHSAASNLYLGPSSQDTQSTTLVGEPYYWNNKSQTEPFEHDVLKKSSTDTIEFIDQGDDSNTTSVDEIKIHPAVLMIALLLVFIIFDFWSTTVQKFVSSRFPGTTTWKMQAVYAIGVSIIGFIIIYMMGIPLSLIETNPIN